ncbi:Holliday junction resolvase RuvX [Mycoplasma phocoeninasale]|uniref:Putative pre-16S rRNA nuclease n=1 Tax=Mycoplasma phocoeninasale TaxID=2726117 RepID=A0A858U2F5_9MOLU|nr:Holliday junction resolvase RuvX [Mycoplasma phocoeninasale]QJG66592.1 Holliday junction resolvase RuvX [Mycoplasma phocoeninasale]
MRKLCLDLGTKSCGFAISDPLGIIVSGLENYNFEENHFKLVISRVLFYLNESVYKNEIDTIVLGYPLRMDLSKSKRTYMVERFASRLAEVISIPIEFQDERQSTINAEEILLTAGYNSKKRKSKKDSLAAQLILEDYLRRESC